ncbi:MAG TPA: hypothetical protein VGV65_05115, partial [Nocardioides sp.]|nr:hypothetical protein [Nocardioides sp.]
DGPCGTSTGTSEPSTDEGQPTATDEGEGTTGEATNSKGGGGGSGGGATTSDGAGTDAAGGGGGGDPATTEVDPITGEVVTADGATATDVTATTDGTTTDPIYATPTELSASRPGDGRAFGALAALELLALILVPGLLLARGVRRRGAGR